MNRLGHGFQVFRNAVTGTGKTICSATVEFDGLVKAVMDNSPRDAFENGALRYLGAGLKDLLVDVPLHMIGMVAPRTADAAISRVNSKVVDWDALFYESDPDT